MLVSIDICSGMGFALILCCCWCPVLRCQHKAIYLPYPNAIKRWCVHLRSSCCAFGRLSPSNFYVLYWLWLFQSVGQSLGCLILLDHFSLCPDIFFVSKVLVKLLKKCHKSTSSVTNLRFPVGFHCSYLTLKIMHMPLWFHLSACSVPHNFPNQWSHYHI